MGEGNPPSLWRRLRAAALATSAAGIVCASAFGAWVYSLGPVPLGEALEFSTVVVDRNGRLLRPYATPDGRWRLPATVADVDPRYLDLLITYEDKRFRQHSGVDPLAVARAAVQLVSHGRIVSGGSTITMQVARLLEPRTDRTFLAKLRQAVRAVQLERVLTKDEILTLYLGLAPYGGNVEGMFKSGAGLSLALTNIANAATSMIYGLGASGVRYSEAQSTLAANQEKASTAATALRDRMTRQFASMDAAVAQYKSIQDALKNQIAAWNNQG